MTDPVIGDPGVSSSRGSVYVFTDPSPGDFIGADAEFELQGIANSATLGEALDVGDFDGDGQRDDLVVGSPGEPSAYVVFGSRTGSLSVRFADLWVHANASGGGVGNTVANAGDVDGDGAEDVIVGAPSYGVGRDTVGQAWLIFDVADRNDIAPDALDATGVARFTGTAASAEMGGSASTAGDRNGDGLAEIAIASSNQGGGVVYVFVGKGL
jgi:hypothetical protein